MHVRVSLSCANAAVSRGRGWRRLCGCVCDSAVGMTVSSKAPQEWEAEAVLGLSLKELVAAVAVGRNAE